MEEEGHLTGRAALGAAPKENHGRPSTLSSRQDGAEIGIGGNHHAMVGRGAIEYHVVGSRSEPERPNVNRVETGLYEPGGHLGGEGVVDQELQPASASGRVRSLTASAA